jgi:hypothetical protein
MRRSQGTIEEWRSHFPCGLPLQALKRLIGRLREFKAIFVDRSPEPYKYRLKFGLADRAGLPSLRGCDLQTRTGAT